MSAAKRKVMACLDLRPEYAALLTTDDAATNLQAVPLWMCTQKARPGLRGGVKGAGIVGVGGAGLRRARCGAQAVLCAKCLFVPAP